MLRSAVITVLAFLFISPCFAETEVFKCGNELVSVGDSKLKVAQMCGDPDSKEQVGTSIQPAQNLEVPEVDKLKMEQWQYNRGYGDYVYILTFEAGVLKRIDTGGRGF